MTLIFADTPIRNPSSVRSILAVCCAVSCLLISNVEAETTMEIVVPAYFYPSPGSDWQDLNAAASQVPLTAIMNPFNGPGNSQDNNYVTAVNDLRSAGGKVIGYVFSGFGNRPLNDVLADIDTYAEWYDIDGIFIDEMANTAAPATLDFYEDIYQHVKTVDPIWEVMGNPGINTQEVYLTRPVADRLMVFEAQGVAYPGNTPSAWNFNYDRSSFVHLVHTEPDATTMESHVDTSVSRNAGGIYVTDDILNNPWDRLPNYWQQQVDKVAAINNFERSPLETLSNAVTNGMVAVDASRNEWDAVASYSADVDTGTPPGPELDLSQLQVANDNDNLFVRYRLDDSNTGIPPALGTLHNLYIDVDLNRDTGYLGTGEVFSVGADYLLQGRILYAFGGTNQEDATWNAVAALTKNDAPSTDVEIAVPLAQLGSPESLDLVFRAANSNVHDLYPNSSQSGLQGGFVRYIVESAVPLSGDYNGDGTVDMDDYSYWKEHLGSANQNADGSGNGIVDAADYTFWLMNLGNSSTSAGTSLAIPEPSTRILLSVLTWALLSREARDKQNCGHVEMAAWGACSVIRHQPNTMIQQINSCHRCDRP